MSPLRTQRARAALAVAALVLALGSLALASPSARPSLANVSEPARLGSRSRAWVSTGAPPGPSAGDGDGGLARPVEESPQRVEDEPGTIIAQIIARFCVPYVAMYCAALADCACPGPNAAPERCEPEWNELCAEWASSTWRGAERLDEAAMDAVLARNADRASACSSLSFEGAPFATALARDGERCPAGALYCADGLCESGMCHAYAEPGAPCWPRGCAPGHVCGADETCVPIVGAGARCAWEVECEWPLACRGGRCRSRGGEGTTCSDESSCEAGMRCGERGRCVVDRECGGRSTECGRDHVCVGTTQRRCVVEEEGVWPLPELGHRCEWACAAGSTCRDGRCVRERGEGRRCREDGDCGLGLACAWRQRGPVCVAAAALGAPCQREGRGLPPCAVDAVCDRETSLCVPRRAPGQVCTAVPCLTGLVCADVIEDAACVPTICEL